MKEILYPAPLEIKFIPKNYSLKEKIKHIKDYHGISPNGKEIKLLEQNKLQEFADLYNFRLNPNRKIKLHYKPRINLNENKGV